MVQKIITTITDRRTWSNLLANPTACTICSLPHSATLRLKVQTQNQIGRKCNYLC
jgi:hypothetical protein